MIKVMNGLICTIGVYMLAWMAYTSVVIFGESGQLCAENILYSSGEFIFVYLILLYCTMGVMLCCVCMFCCVVASNKKKKSQLPTAPTDLSRNML